MNVSKEPKNSVPTQLVAAALLPFLIDAICLYFSRWPKKWDTGTSDVFSLAISLGVGAALLAALPCRTGFKALLLILYVPIIGILLFYFAFFFVALVFKDAI